MLVISDAQSFRFDIGHVAYRAVCGKVGDDDDPFGDSPSPSLSLTSIVDTDKIIVESGRRAAR
jgi:hypothetical protein